MVKSILQSIVRVVTVWLGLLLGFQLSFCEDVACLNGWVRHGTSCYYAYNHTTQKLSFWKARQWCQKQNYSDLTSVLSQEEENFLDYLINATHLRKSESFYIGLRTTINNIAWKWVRKEPYNYTNWFQGEEPPLPASGEPQKCAFYNDTHQWMVETWCGVKRLFICKQQQPQQQRQQQTNTATTTTTTTTTTAKITVETRPGTTSTNISPSTSIPTSPTTTSIPSPTTAKISISSTDDPTNQAFNKLNERLAALEGATLNDSSAEQYMKELGEDLDSVLGSWSTGGKSLSPADLGEAVKMGEKIGELIVSGLKRGGNITTPKSIQITTNALALGIDVVPSASAENRTMSVSFPLDDTETNKIKLPASLIWKAQSSDGVSVTHVLLPTVSATADPQSKRVLISGIIASTILFSNGSKFDNLSEPVIIRLSADNKADAESQRFCAFLDSTNDSWSSSGCVVYRQDLTYTECHCYHMTSYAVLMDVHGAFESDAISEKDKFVLSTVSIVGCLIAFVCYIILLCTFYFLRRRTETTSIHMHLAVAEALAIFFFLIAYAANGTKGVCFAVAVLLFYFQLASFCWMLVEGINLLRGLVKVFRVTSRLKTYYLFAWGQSKLSVMQSTLTLRTPCFDKHSDYKDSSLIPSKNNLQTFDKENSRYYGLLLMRTLTKGLPVVVVAVISSIFRHQFLRENFCWLSHGLIWSFAGPVACVLAVNLVVLVMAIRIVVRRARYKAKPNEKNTASSFQVEIRAAFKTAVILMPLLGVTWLLGFISIHEKSPVFQYLFAVINSMQGVYFLIAQYFFDDDVKRNAHRASNRMKRLFSLSTTKSTRSSSSSERRRSKSLSDKRPALTMRPSLVSPQQSIHKKETKDENAHAGKPSLTDDERNNNSNGNHLCKRKSITFQQPITADQEDGEGKTESPRLNGGVQQKSEKKCSDFTPLSTADKKEESEKDMIGCQQSSADEYVQGNDETTSETKQNTTELPNSGHEQRVKKIEVTPFKSPRFIVNQEKDSQEIPDEQQGNQKNVVSCTGDKQSWSGGDDLESKYTAANEDKNCSTENVNSQQEKQTNQQHYHHIHHQNDRDQAKLETEWLSSGLPSLCASNNSKL